MKNNKNLSQTGAIVECFKANRNRKMTASEIAETIYKTFRKKYTSSQIATTLSTLRDRNKATFDKKGTSLRGTPCYRWKMTSMPKGNTLSRKSS